MELHNYQKRLANFIAQNKQAIISVDMGLGKTAAVLTWLDWIERKNDYTLKGLIIAPKRVAENNWLQEAQKWGMDELSKRMTICAGLAGKRAKNWNNETKPIKIISRDLCKDYANTECDILILDELTSYKNPMSIRSKAVRSVRATTKVGLTGTFLANGAIDVFGQAAAVGIDWQGLNYYAWRATYFKDLLAGSGLAFQKWRLKVGLEDLLKPIKDNIFTLTAEDYLTIPETMETTHKVDVGEDTRKAIGDLDAFLSFDLADRVLTFDEKQKFAKLQTLCNGFVYDCNGEVVRGVRSVKLETVADFVSDCKDAGEPVLLFYAFVAEAEWLEELLKGRGVKCDRVTKRGFIERWNNRETDCLLAHPASAGHGLNLQHGGRVIVWSTLTYNYELFAQGNARLARQGQKRNVQIHYFVADKTCEERAVAALRFKDREQKQFLQLTKQ